MMEFIKKNKVTLIVATVIWLLAAIFLIAPIAYSVFNSYANGVFHIDTFVKEVITNVSSFSSIGKVFQEGVIGKFISGLFIFTIFYAICFGIGLYKGRKKSEFDKIEHGSSDWSQNGEQYRVLSRNTGLILAENNYLPLNKSGNVNVLIVGGSGSGKSASYSKPNAHQCLGSYIFTDPKGEIYDDTAGGDGLLQY